MAVVNVSYIVDTTELGLLTNFNVWKQLCVIDADNVTVTDVRSWPDLSGTPLDRSWTALNAASQIVDSLLKNVYSVPFGAPTATNPNLLVKGWVVQFGMWWLYRFHADRATGIPQGWNDMVAQIEPYIVPNGLEIPGHARSAQTLPFMRWGRQINSGSPYDRAEMWDQQVITDYDGPSDGR